MNRNSGRKTNLVLSALLLIALVLSACGAAAPETPDSKLVNTAVAQTLAAQPSQTARAVNTLTVGQRVNATVEAMDTPGSVNLAKPGKGGDASSTPTATTSVGQTGMSGTGNSTCPNPGDLEAMPRSTVDQAVAGQWFHPIYDVTDYQSSDGYEGQMSWANTLCLLPSSGGFFKHFEGDDGEFVFRMNTSQAHVAFATLSTSKWASQFLEGANYQIALNIRAMPGTTVNVTDHNGKVTSQAVSIAGDITVILPTNGVTTFSFDVTDPATTFEVKFWYGPYDRSANINTIDAR